MRLLAATSLCLVVSCGGRGTRPAAADPAPRPLAGQPMAGQPMAGQQVPPGDTLQQAIDAAPANAVLVLQAGDYRGPFVVKKPLTIWGPATAVLHAREGTNVRVEANGVTLSGFTVAGSGQRYDLTDGGVHLQGEDLTVQGLTLRDTLFGILVEHCTRATVRGNRVVGTGLPAMGLRGDGIRLWETSDSVVEDNVVTDCRDMVVWYSSRNRLSRNTVLRSRYGTHFMYSHDNVVEDSYYAEDEVGVFVMYSHGIRLRRNLLAKAGGPAGIGIGLKESGDVTVEDNWLLANTTGLYADNAPLDPTHWNRYLRNVFRFTETAVSLHSRSRRSEFTDNQFRDNGTVVKVGGRGDAMECTFSGNYYDTYQGYDFDGDDRGDVPFEFRRLSTQLEGRYPQLALLHGAPAMMMTDLVGEVMPLFSPKRLMQDNSPRLRPFPMAWTPEVRDAR